MRSIATVSLLVAVAASAGTTSKLEPGTRLRLALADREAQPLHSRAEGEEQPEERNIYRPLILQIDAENTVDSLLDLDVIIYKRRDDMLLTSVPKEKLTEVIALEGVINAAVSGDMASCLDMARPFCNVDAAQQYRWNATGGFDGSGVVVGFSDIGFDAHHIAFRDRVAAIYDYDTPKGEVRSATTAAEISEWVTDDADNYHATHVGNILAGGYMGNPYYGVAKGAEIVATTSRMNDVGILSGVEDIISYAREKGKRAVINLSLSSMLGPHDGTDLLCRYLSSCARDAVLCISAGNAGNTSCFATQNLMEGDGAVLVNNLKTWNGFEVSGFTDIWSNSGSPFEFSFKVYDKNTDTFVYSSPWITDEAELTVDGEDEEWTQYMEGLMYAESGWSKLNGRYNVSIYYNISTTAKAQAGEWSRYAPCLYVRKASGVDEPVTVDYFSDATRSFLGVLKGYNTKVGSQGSINDMCTAEGVISVGMACSRKSVPVLGAPDETWDITIGTISKNSSYSDVPTIKPLPIISAAGKYVISAVSTPYVETHPKEELSAESEVDGCDYYWISTSGTSMSAPLTAGIIALWLQADPSLTTADIIDIACSTAKKDYIDIDNPRWGAGCIDAIAGLQEVINRSGIIDAEMPVRISVDSDRRLVVEGVDSGSVRVVSVSGVCMNPIQPLPIGVYVVYGEEFSPCKILVK